MATQLWQTVSWQPETSSIELTAMPDWCTLTILQEG